MTSIQIDRLDGLSSSVAIKGPCRVATTGDIALYGLQTIDGVVLDIGDRVLVRAQAAPYENGVYRCDTGQWQRVRDFNKTRDVVRGTWVYVTDGSLYAKSGWIVANLDKIIVGTSDIIFEQNVLLNAAQLEQLVEEAAQSAADAANSASQASGFNDDAQDAADRAELAAGSLLVNFPSRQSITTTVIPPFISYARTAGYWAAGDGGKALYKRVVSEPVHAGKVQSLDGAWWELCEDVVNFRIFGAKIDGSTDDTAAWNAALDYCFATATAKELYFPAGFMKLIGPLRDISDPITIRGAGRRNSVITLSGTTGVAVRGLVSRSADVVLYNFSVNGAAMTGGDALTIDFAQATVFTEISVFNPFNGIYMRQMGNAVFNNVIVDGTIRGSYGWKAYGANVARNGENDQIDVIQFNNCLVQSTYDGTTTVPAAEGLVFDGRVHSAQFNGMRCLSLLRGFVVRNTPALPSNLVPSFIKGSGLEVENTYSEGMLFEAGNMVELSDAFQARSFRSNGITIGPACGTIEFNGLHAATNYYHGVNNQGAAALTILRPKVYNNSLAAGNTYSGIRLGAAGRTKVSSGLSGKLEGVPSYNENQKYGIEWDAGFTGEIQAQGVNLSGNATAALIELGAPALGSYVRGCSGYNPGTTVAKTVPATGGTIQAGLRDEFINVIGGTGVSIQIDGLFVVNATPGGFMLPARKTATVAYSTAPTMTAIRL